MISRWVRHSPLLLLACGTGIVCLLAPWAGMVSLLGVAPRYLLALWGAFALYLVAGAAILRAPGECSSRPGLMVIAGIALVARLALAGSAPTLSTDIYRYLWDGKVALHGHNPYALPPDAPALESLRGPYWERINHKEIRTPYPPVSQACFRLAAGFGQDAVLPLKTLLILADLLAMGALLIMLRQAGRPPAYVLFYAWNPLVISETALSGHVDVLAIALFLAAVAALGRPEARWQVLGAGVLGLSLAAKPFALVALPILARWRGFRVPLIAAAAAVVTYLPYLDAGPYLLEGIREMAARWRTNGSLYEVAFRLLAGQVPHPNVTARHVLLAGLLAVVLLLARRPVASPGDLWRRLYYAFLAALLTSAVVYPWYTLWLAPFLALVHPLSGFVFTALVSIKHIPLWLPPPVVTRLWIEYAPLYALLLWETLRLAKGTAPEGQGLPATAQRYSSGPSDRSSR